MFYKDNTIIYSIPNSITLANGTLVTDPVIDINILADAGYLTIRTDQPTQPENTMED